MRLSILLAGLPGTGAEFEINFWACLLHLVPTPWQDRYAMNLGIIGLELMRQKIITMAQCIKSVDGARSISCQSEKEIGKS